MGYFAAANKMVSKVRYLPFVFTEHGVLCCLMRLILKKRSIFTYTLWCPARLA